MLKFFAEKMWVAAIHIFSAKNIIILYTESAKTVNEMTLNELVKLTTLWITGRRSWSITSWRGLDVKIFRSIMVNIKCWQDRKLIFITHVACVGGRFDKLIWNFLNALVSLSTGLTSDIINYLTLKAPITTAADDILKYIFFNFSK